MATKSPRVESRPSLYTQGAVPRDHALVLVFGTAPRPRQRPRRFAASNFQAAHAASVVTGGVPLFPSASLDFLDRWLSEQQPATVDFERAPPINASRWFLQTTMLQFRGFLVGLAVQ